MFMIRPFVAVVGTLAALILAGCSVHEHGIGEEKGNCFPNGTCNAGLSCFSNLCVKLGPDGGAGIDAAGGSTGAGGSGVVGAGTAGTTGTAGSGGAGAGTAGASGTTGGAGAGGGAGVVGTGGTGAAGSSAAGSSGAAGTGGLGGTSGGGAGGLAIPKVFSMATVVNYPARSPQAVVVYDLNEDGKLDVATVSFDGYASVLLGNGNGTLQQQKAYGSSGSTSGTGIVVADFNSDGKPDLAIAMARYGFGTFLGKGDGTFGAFAFGSSGDMGGIAAADLNKDGKPDVVVPISQAGGVDICIGNGNGTFVPPPFVYQTTTNPYGVIVADFDHDGKLDVATAGDGSVGISLGNGDGTFPLTGMKFPLSSGTTIASLAAGDFNMDGLLDVVAPDSGGVTVNVLLGKGDGTLLAAKQFPCGEHPAGVTVADLNLDGNPDIIETNDVGPGNAGSLGVLLGKGDGTFEPFVSFATGMGAHAVAVGDLNADGLPDLAVAAKDQASVSVLLNTSK